MLLFVLNVPSTTWIYSRSLHDALPFSAHESVIGQILTMNLLRIQAFWSHYRFRRQNPLLNYLLHQQLRMTSVISSLRRMLLNWPTAPARTREILESLLNELAYTNADALSVARIIAPLAQPADADYRHIAFWKRLHYFCPLYLVRSRWLTRIETATPSPEFHVPSSPALPRHTDHAHTP